MKGYFVTATGTDVGKTFVTALLVKKWRDSGIDAGYYKAALSGAELRNGTWVAGDADYVKRIANLPDSQEELVSYVYKEAVSPHLAARKEGNPVELAQVKKDFDAATKRHEFIFVEGSGGIMGLGETMEDRIDMCIDIRDLGVKSTPINVLNAIPGTPFENLPKVTNDEFCRIVAIYRFINPKAYLRLAGGRGVLGDFGAKAFKSGANATITDDMLTTAGVNNKTDFELVKNLGFNPHGFLKD